MVCHYTNIYKEKLFMVVTAVVATMMMVLVVLLMVFMIAVVRVAAVMAVVVPVVVPVRVVVVSPARVAMMAVIVIIPVTVPIIIPVIVPGAIPAVYSQINRRIIVIIIARLIHPVAVVIKIPLSKLGKEDRRAVRRRHIDLNRARRRVEGGFLLAHFAPFIEDDGIQFARPLRQILVGACIDLNIGRIQG